jgi:hypothetical protein
MEGAFHAVRRAVVQVFRWGEKAANEGKKLPLGGFRCFIAPA